MNKNQMKIKIFNSEKNAEVEDDFEEFMIDKELIDIRYSTTGVGGSNRDAVCVLYKEKTK